MSEWVPYVLTFLGGSGFGAVLSYLFSPKKDRDAQALEREKWEHERDANSRQDARASLKRAVVELEEMFLLACRYRENNESWLQPPLSPEALADVREADRDFARSKAVLPGIMTSIYSLPNSLVPSNVKDQTVDAMRASHLQFVEYVGKYQRGKHAEHTFGAFMQSNTTSMFLLNRVLMDSESIKPADRKP